MATPNKTADRNETPIFFEVLEASNTTERDFREQTKALDPQSWDKAVAEQ